MIGFKRHLRPAIGLVLLVLIACAVPIQDPRFQQRQSELLGQELGQVGGESAAVRRIYFLGIALFPESWSENDVTEAASLLQNGARSSEFHSIILSNNLTSIPERYPAVDEQSVERAAASLAAHARPDDIIFVYLSSHGSRGALVRKVGIFNQEPLRSAESQKWLTPLGERKTVIIVSACYSGSLIGSLHAANRIVMTASRSDRQSFGCRANARHTDFGEALLESLAVPNQSLAAIFAKTKENVAVREQRDHLSPPSEPQVFVGDEMARVFEEASF